MPREAGGRKRPTTCSHAAGTSGGCRELHRVAGPHRRLLDGPPRRRTPLCAPGHRRGELPVVEPIQPEETPRPPRPRLEDAVSTIVSPDRILKELSQLWTSMGKEGQSESAAG